VTPALQRELRQFRLLARHSVGRLMDAALASRDTDATQFAIWGTALVATLPFFYTAKMMGIYTFLARRPDALERVVIADRLFFVCYAMLAAALLAAALWDALFPDRQDQEIVGVLPVRARTLAASRLSTALLVGTAFSLLTALPSAVMYMINVASAFRSSELIGWWGPVFVGHLLAMTAAGVFTFATLLALRGIAVLCIGADAAQRAAAVLQLVTIILLVEVFIFLPSVVPSLSGALAAQNALALFAPLWFLGLYAEFAGPPAARVEGLALMGVAFPVAAVLAAAATYIVPASRNARRALEARTTDRASRLIAIASKAARLVLRTPAARAIFTFTVASLARSRRHALIIATYLGLAFAVAGVRLIAATLRDRPLALDAPHDYLLALPLVITFFLVFALRSAFAVPTDIEANWTFRAAQPRSTRPCIQAVALVMTAIAVVPLSAASFLVTLFLWNLSDAASAAALHFASGLALVELAVLDCQAVPFTRAHTASSDTVQFRWAWFLVGLHLYAFRLDDLQLDAMGSARGVGVYICGMLAIAAAARLYRRSRRASWSLRFDAPVEPAAETLNLSQALG